MEESNKPEDMPPDISEVKDTENPQSSVEPIETLQSSFPGNSKRKNYHHKQSHFDSRFNNNQNHYQNYSSNYANQNTMNKGHRTNSVNYYGNSRYGNQNTNKNSMNDTRKNYTNYLGKKKKKF